MGSLRHAIITVALVALGAAAEGPPVLTLPDALKLAGQGNRKVLSSQLEVARNEDLLSYQNAQRRPNLHLQITNARLLTPIDFRVPAGALGAYQGIGPIPPTDQVISQVTGGQNTLRVVFSQPLTGLHRTGLQVGYQQDEVDVARQSSRSQAQSVTAQVKQLYYDLLDNQNALAAVRENLEFYRELERVTEEFLKQQTALRQELLDVRARRLDQEYQLVALQNARDQQREQLNILLGRDITTPFRVSNPEELENGTGETLEALLQEAAQKRPEVLQGQLRIQQAETNREIQRADYIPDMSMELIYQRSQNSGLLPPDLAFLQLRTEWDALDFGRRDAQVAANDKQVQQAEQQLADTRSQVASDVSTRFRKLSELKAQETARRAAVEAAEEKQRVTLNRYLQKAALTRDVLQAQAELTAARRDHRKLQLDVASAVAELNRSVGRD